MTHAIEIVAPLVALWLFVKFSPAVMALLAIVARSQWDSSRPARWGTILIWLFAIAMILIPITR